ncbi:hypothetical protein BHE17_12090 [Planococcus maritimus]|uniref:hypothetical protein n=1 Tax=Planococcus maritimus TaxID=192421 RepID=UPI00084C8E36|nr:hypothetical protein [Planococcus maritimus]OED33150.1 hypothetical protein BHE17_12090 [Planococcus maritimus]
MKKLPVVLMCLFATTVLSACQNGLIGAEQRDTDKLVLHQMERFGEVKENTRTEVTDTQAIELFADAISRADKLQGIADVIDPDFQLDFGGKTFYLWVSEDQGSVMDESDTHALYTLKEKDAEELYSYLSSENLLDGLTDHRGGR